MNNTVATLNSIDFNTMTGSELAKWFGIARFSDRKTAIRRCEAKRTEMLLTMLVESEPAVEEVKIEEVETTTKARRSAAEGIAESWKNPEVAAKRLTRNAVVANGMEFRSVRAAFFALGLPDNKHIAFRMQLKAKGFAEFDGIKFVIAD